MDTLVATLSRWNAAESATLLLYALLVGVPAWYLATYLTSPLRCFPGPFLAGKAEDYFPELIKLK